MKEFDSGFEKLKFQETVLLPCIVDELSIRDLYQKVDLQTNKQETQDTHSKIMRRHSGTDRLGAAFQKVLQEQAD